MNLKTYTFDNNVEIKIEKPLTSLPNAEVVLALIRNDNDKFNLIKAVYLGAIQLIKRTKEEIIFLPEGWYKVDDCNNCSKINKKIYDWKYIPTHNYNAVEYGESNNLT